MEAFANAQYETIWDADKAEAFAGKMLQVFNDGCLALLCSVGHQSGLFDTLAEVSPATSEELAAAAGLNERYVREWLGGVTVGGIVEYDPSTRTFTLPAEHAAFTTTRAGADNFAMFTQYVGLMAETEQQVVEAFRNGGGVPYSAMPRFHKIQGEESKLTYDASLIQSILPLQPELIEALERGIRVADVGCGAGHATNLLAKHFPRSRVVGLDFSDDGLRFAREEAAALGLENIEFEAVDVANWDGAEQFDLVTAFDAIHDQAHPDAVLANISRALKPGGTFLMVDMLASSNLEENLDHPLGTALYTFSVMHCMTVSLAQGGKGLGTCWGEQTATRMLAEAGLRDIRVRRVEGDIMHLFYFATK